VIGSAFSLTATSPVEKDFFNDYVFDHREVNGASSGTTLTIQLTVDSAKEVKAIYRTELNLVKVGAVGGGTIVVLAVVAFFILRKPKPPAAPVPAPPPPPG